MKSKESEQNRDIVLYFSAGAMSGIFSAGFASVLSETNIKKRIHSVYGNSAGSLTALYFLSNQDKFGSQMYYEYLDGNKYIKWNRLVRYFFAGLSNRLFGTTFKILPVFDIDYVKEVIANILKIDYRTIKQTGIELYMLAYNIKTRTHDHLQVEKEEDILPFLKASAGGQPAYPYAAKVGSRRYIDGGTINDKRRIERIIGQNPGKNIVCVLNNPKFQGGKIKIAIDKAGMALVMWPFFGLKEAWLTFTSDFGNLDVRDLKILFPHVYFVANDILGKQMSTNPKDHKCLYENGRKHAKRFLSSPDFKKMHPLC